MVMAGAMGGLRDAWRKDLVTSIEDRLEADHPSNVGEMAVSAVKGGISATAYKVLLYGGAAFGAYVAAWAVGDGAPWVINQATQWASQVTAGAPLISGGFHNLYIGSGYGLGDGVNSAQQLVTQQGGLGNSMRNVMETVVGATFVGKEILAPPVRALGNAWYGR